MAWLLAAAVAVSAAQGATGTGVHPGVDMSMRIHNVSYDQLVSRPTLLDQFVGHMEAGLVAATDHSVGPQHVWMRLDRGSGFIWVNWDVVPPAGVSADALRTLLLRPGTGQLLTQYALNFTGLAQASLGVVAVTYVTGAQVVVEQHIPLPTPTPSPAVDFTRYMRIPHLQDCKAGDFQIPSVDGPEEVVVWVAYLGYVVALVVVCGASFLLCDNMMTRLKKRVTHVEERENETALERAKAEKEEEEEEKEEDKEKKEADDGPVVPVAPEDGYDDEEFKDFRPNRPEAEKHLAATSATDGKGRWRSVLFTGAGDMDEVGGSGTELYFRLLRTLGFTFFFMSGLVLPTVVISAGGDFAPDVGGDLVRTTVGNLGFLEEGGLPKQEARLVSVPLLGCKLIPAATVTTFLAWFDFGATLVFLAVIVYFRFHVVPRTHRISDRESVTCQDYTVEVDCLPEVAEDMREYETLLREHLMRNFEEIEEKRKRREAQAQKISSQAKSAFGAPLAPAEICEMVLVRDFDGRLGAVKSRAELFPQLRLAAFKKDEKATEKLERRIDELSLKLKDKLRPEEELPVVRAYVTLNSPAHADALAFYYRFSANPLLRRLQGWQRRFLDEAIRVRKAPEPSNVIWENQDLSYWSRMARRAATQVVFFVLLFLSMVLIYVTLVSTSREAGSSLNYLDDETCDPVYRTAAENGGKAVYKCMVSQAERWTVQQAQATPETLECWCLMQGTSKILSDGAIRDVCTPWLEQVAKKMGVMGAATVVVVLINVILQTALLWLAEVERSPSVSGKDSSLMWKIAVAQTLNTGILPVAVNFCFPQTLQDVVKVIPGLNFVGQGDYKDFVRGWYTAVGLSLLVNMLSSAFTPACVNLFKALLGSLKRWCCTRRRFLEGYAQPELIELFTNPVFDMSVRYAQLMMIVFVTLMFSSGLPLLNVFAAVYMFVTYWADKYVLLRASKRPPFYDTQMPSMASQSLIYAVPLHCVLAILMLGQPCTFPSGGGDLGGLSGTAVTTASGSAGLFSTSRLTRSSTWMLFGLLAVFLALWAVWTLLWALALDVVWRYAMKLVWSGGRAPAEEEQEDLPWRLAKPHIERSYPPASYRLEDSPDFKKLAMYLAADASSRGKPNAAVNPWCGGSSPKDPGDSGSASEAAGQRGGQGGGREKEKEGEQEPPPELDMMVEALAVSQARKPPRDPPARRVERDLVVEETAADGFDGVLPAARSL